MPTASAAEAEEETAGTKAVMAAESAAMRVALFMELLGFRLSREANAQQRGGFHGQRA